MLPETLRFLRRHWPHLLLFVPGVIVVTVIHESAHAIAVLLQGGTVSEFIWLPSDDKWGSVSYDLPHGSERAAYLISLAPNLLWLLFATLACALSFRRQPCGYWQASFIYVWLFVVPLADIANTAFPYLTGKTNDFRSAFGPPAALAGPLVAAFCALTFSAGYFLQRRLYRADRLSAPSYLALGTVTFIMLLTFIVWKPLV
jgi:hypothetical protein